MSTMPKHGGDLEGAPLAGNGPRPWALAVVVALLVLVVGSAFAVLVPAGQVLDEPMHVARVEQLAEGRLLPQEVGPDGLDMSIVAPASDKYQAYGGQTDRALYELVVQGNLTYYGGGAPFAFPSWEDERLSVDAQMGEGTVTWIFPNTAINSPLSYAPHVLGYWLGRLVTTSPVVVVILMRLAGVVTLAAATLVCMRLLPGGSRVLALVVLLPQSISTNAMVTADLMTFVTSLVYVSCLVRMLWLDAAGRLEWALLWASLFGLCLCKMTYAPFGLLLLVLPIASATWRSRASLVRIGVVGVSSLVAFAAWYLVVKDVNTGLMWAPAIVPEEQARYVAEHPLAFLNLLVRGLLGTDVLALGPATPLSSLASASWVVALPLMAALVCDAVRAARWGAAVRRLRVLALALVPVLAIIVTLIYLALYLQFNAPGAGTISGVQVRYFLPLLFPLLLSVLVVCLSCCGVGRRGAGRDAALAESPQAAVLAEAVPPASDMLVGALLVLLSLLMLASLVWTVF